MPTTIDIESQRMLLGSTPVRKLYHGANLIGARIAELFAGGVPGVWYDPSDLSTLFQDAAGVTQVTGVEQPVGLMLDKSGRGNHAFQATTTARPILSARYNLLTNTDSLTGGGWVALAPNTTVTPGFASPLGENTAARVQMTATSGSLLNHLFTATAGHTYRLRFIAKRGGSSSHFSFGFAGTSSGAFLNVNVNDLSDDWREFFVDYTAPSSGQLWTGIDNVNNGQEIDVLIAGIDLRLAADVQSLPPYQRVVSTSEYSTNGFPYYLQFDGVDDFLDAGTIDFSAATQATAVIGVKKLSDAIVGRPYSHGLVSQNGAFGFRAPATPGQASVRAASRGVDGVARETVGTNDKAAPIKLVLCSTYGAGAPVSIRYNGTESRVSSGSLGALTLPSARSVIGAQVTGGTTQSSFFLGRIYGLAHIARALSLSEQRILEQFMRNKSRAY